MEDLKVAVWRKWRCVVHCRTDIFFCLVDESLFLAVWCLADAVGCVPCTVACVDFFRWVWMFWCCSRREGCVAGSSTMAAGCTVSCVCLWLSSIAPRLSARPTWPPRLRCCPCRPYSWLLWRFNRPTGIDTQTLEIKPWRSRRPQGCRSSYTPR